MPYGGTPIVIDIRPCLRLVPQIYTAINNHVNGPGSTLDSIRQPTSSPPSTQDTNAIIFNNSANQSYISVLRQYTDDDSVVIHTLSDSGHQQSAVLTQLPKWDDIEGAYITLLNPFENGDWLRMVLNKAQQKTYGLDDPIDAHLPALVQRKNSSILVSNQRDKRISKELTGKQPCLLAQDRRSSWELQQSHSLSHNGATNSLEAMDTTRPRKEVFDGSRPIPLRKKKRFNPERNATPRNSRFRFIKRP